MLLLFVVVVVAFVVVNVCFGLYFLFVVEFLFFFIARKRVLAKAQEGHFLESLPWDRLSKAGYASGATKMAKASSLHDKQNFSFHSLRCDFHDCLKRQGDRDLVIEKVYNSAYSDHSAYCLHKQAGASHNMTTTAQLHFLKSKFLILVELSMIISLTFLFAMIYVYLSAPNQLFKWIGFLDL